MNVRQLTCALILPSVAWSLGGLCAAVGSSAPLSSVPASCEAPGTSAAIERALCSGNPSELQDALFKDTTRPFELGHGPELLAALQSVWNADGDYGRAAVASIEDALSRRNRAVVAEYLAQGVRTRRSSGSAKGLQQFAVEFARGAKTDAEQLDGLRLLGLTDAKKSKCRYCVRLRYLLRVPQCDERVCDRGARQNLCARSGGRASRNRERTIPADGE